MSPADSAGSGDPLEDFLRSFLPGEAAEQAARQLRDSGLEVSGMLPLHNPALMQQLTAQAKALFSSGNEPVNWTLAKQAATQAINLSGSETVTAEQAAQIRQALTVADLWLDPVTNFTAPGANREVWQRSDWLENTLEAWKEICNPVAARIAKVFAETLVARMPEADTPPEVIEETLAEVLGQAPSSYMILPPAAVQQVVPQLTAATLAYTVGNALGTLAQEALSAGDSGFPLVKTPMTALVARNLEKFSDGLEIPAAEVLQFVAVRECASARLFASVPWLQTDLELAIRNYAEQITLDIEAIENIAQDIDISDLNQASFAAANQLFGPEVFSANPTEGQLRALERLETLLALVEGWVEIVTARAVAPYLPDADRLREMMRRRRVAGTPGEQLLGQLVGLQMRPRHARAAAQIFHLVQDSSQANQEGRNGGEARDHLWSHPDLIPTMSELDSPDTFLALREAANQETTQVDEALEQLLDGTLGWAEGLEPGEEPGAEPGADSAK